MAKITQVEKWGKHLSIKHLPLTRPKGLEPSTFGSTVRLPNPSTTDKTKTCETAKEQLTPQLTPKSRKQPQETARKDQQLPVDLAEIVTVWPELPEHIKQSVNALIGMYTSTKKQE